MSDPLHYDYSAFMAHRSRVAQTIEIDPPTHVALPGALTPISADRLEAHQDDGLSELEIVEYENAHFLEANAHIRERHRRWVARDYDAMVQANQALEAEKRAKEAQASAEYRNKLAEILAAKDAYDAEREQIEAAEDDLAGDA